jgi:micrococcal nuclease
VAALVGGAWLNGGLGSISEDGRAPDPALARVVSVTDGDTIRVRYVSGFVGPVRYIGIDTPERGDCFFERASTANRRLVEGETVRLVFDRDRKDRYDRLLAYVYLPDGTFVNEQLVRQGFASDLTVPPNVKFAERFGRLADEARAGDLGLWKACR